MEIIVTFGCAFGVLALPIWLRYIALVLVSVLALPCVGLFVYLSKRGHNGLGWLILMLGGLLVGSLGIFCVVA